MVKYKRLTITVPEPLLLKLQKNRRENLQNISGFMSLASLRELNRRGFR